jgi:hypothetical protein
VQEQKLVFENDEFFLKLFSSNACVYENFSLSLHYQTKTDNNMELTLTYIKQAFSKYNAMYFNNELHTPIFELFKSKTTLGQFCVQNAHYARFGGVPTIKIRISNYYKREERDFDNTIIHEMIHQWIHQNGIKDTSSHGKYWLCVARRINKDGWDIQPKSTAHYEVKNTNKEYCIFSFLDTANRRFICRVNPKKQQWFANAFKFNNFTNIVQFTSKNSSKFDCFVNCQSSLRGKYINQKQWEDYCVGERVEVLK